MICLMVFELVFSVFFFELSSNERGVHVVRNGMGLRVRETKFALFFSC